jgi:hypothetical protein
MVIRTAVLALALAVLLVQAPATRAQEDTVGLVVAQRGQVTVTAPDGGERFLSCGDLVHAGHLVRTHEASRVAILTGDVYAQLFVLSEGRFDTTPDGTALLKLERGRMRVVDPRAGTNITPVHVTASGSEARFAGNDVDVYVLGPADATNGVICSERVSLDVARPGSGESITAHRDRCAIASLGKPLYTAEIPSERIALAEANDCELPIADALVLHFAPDVAAGAADTPLPTSDVDPTRDACDVPGSGCGAVPTSGPVDTLPPFPWDRLPGVTNGAQEAQ